MRVVLHPILRSIDMANFIQTKIIVWHNFIGKLMRNLFKILNQDWLSFPDLDKNRPQVKWSQPMQQGLPD